MKKVLTPINIESAINVTDEMIEEAEKIENSPEKMLQLIDMLFLCSEQERILS